MSETPPPLGPVIRHYGPPVLITIALVGLGAAYLDLRARVARLEREGAASPMPVLEADAGVSLDAGVAPATLVARGVTPDWRCSGGIASQYVQRSIGRHGSAVYRCYSERLREQPSLAGTLVVRLRVGANGASTAAHVGGIDDAELVECVGNDALTWEFPPPSGGECAIVEAPFALRPPEAPAAPLP
jgi:hypothetical protein